MVLANSHLLLVTSGAVIGGTREFTLLVTNGAVINGSGEFTSVVSN